MIIEEVEEMKAAFDKELTLMCHNRIEKVMENYLSESGQYRKGFQEMVKILAGERQGSIVISWLRSSYITESHKFKVAFYSGRIYLEEEPDSAMYSISPLLKGLEQDIDAMEKTIRTKFFRLYSSGKEEIRRYYSEQIYRQCEGLFRQMSAGLQEELAVKIYYGEYMGETLLL